MRTHYYYSIITLILLFNSYIIAALNPIVIKGQNFFDSVTKEQFFIKGVAYQPREDDVTTNTTTSDPLANPEGCKRDAPLIKDLGANVIRVYQVDHTKNHDACMNTMAENGLYVILGVSTPQYSINRDHPTYDVSMYNAYRATVTSFATYPHVLAFIAGNEVTNGTTNTPAASYAKAVIRDIKSLLHQSDLRVVPVGYASNDDMSIRDSVKDFFVCDGDDQNTNNNSHADFLGLNLYEWCGGATFESSGYAARTKELEAYGRPVFLSEYGCNVVEPRTFDEVEAIYGSQMTAVWSGGVVYEWSQENAYGLVKIASSHANNVEPLTDYTNLYKVLRAVDPKGVKMDDYQVPAAPPVPPCPAKSPNWDAATTLPPTPSEGACQCLKDNLSCVLADAVNNETIIGAQLDIMCGLVSCKEISESEKGIYGAFSFCNAAQKLSWLYHLYVTQTKHSASPVQCDFNGYAKPIVPRRNDINTCASIKPDTSISSNTANSRLVTSPSLLLALYFSLLLFFISV